MTTLPAQDSELPLISRSLLGTNAFTPAFRFHVLNFAIFNLGMPSPSTTGSGVSKTLSNA